MAATRWPYELIDLSGPLTRATVEALFGDLVANEQNAYFADFALEVASDHQTATAYSCVVRVPEHMGTHMDAPIHTVSGAGRLETVDLRRLIGEAVVLDLDRIKGRRVRFAALPPNIPGGSGFPVRAVAWLDAPA